MRPAEVAALLPMRGYTLADRELSLSCTAGTAPRVSTSLAPRGATDDNCVAAERYVRGFEEVSITYVPVPADSVVSEVAYYAPPTVMSASRFAVTLMERYGPPGTAEDQVSLYCSHGESHCSFDASAGSTKLPSLVAYSGADGYRLVLHEGSAAMAAH
jgi:hypothetical protein